jgi:hypothetical protein
VADTMMLVRGAIGCAGHRACAGGWQTSMQQSLFHKYRAGAAGTCICRLDGKPNTAVDSV